MSYGYRFWMEGSSKLNIPCTNDVDAVGQFLLNVIEEAGMTLLAGPLVGKEPPRGIGKGPGVSGIALLCESSVHIHTYPEQGYFFFELFSCKGFNSRDIEMLVSAFVRGKEYTMTYESVGEDFPEPVVA